MFFFIAQNHQDFFSIFKTRVHREYNYINRIIDENKNERIHKNNLENIHCFLLSRVLYEEYILFQKSINELSDKNEIDDENSIKHADFDKVARVNCILTERSVQNFNDLRLI